MKEFRFGSRSRDNLKGVNPGLIAVAYRGLYLSPYDFGITEGVRSFERQRSLVAEGASDTLKSKHLTGDAFDFAVWVDGNITWEFRYYEIVKDSIQQAADEFGVKIRWGGTFRLKNGGKDGPHVEKV